jgi:hypothetical protein
VAQLASVLFLWFISLIPNYDTPQPAVAEFWIELSATTTVFFGALQLLSSHSRYSFVFVGGFSLNKLHILKLNSSAVLTSLPLVSSPIVTLFFVIFLHQLWTERLCFPVLEYSFFAVAFYRSCWRSYSRTEAR